MVLQDIEWDTNQYVANINYVDGSEHGVCNVQILRQILIGKDHGSSTGIFGYHMDGWW